MEDNKYLDGVLDGPATGNMEEEIQVVSLARAAARVVQRQLIHDRGTICIEEYRKFKEWEGRHKEQFDKESSKFTGVSGFIEDEEGWEPVRKKLEEERFERIKKRWDTIKSRIATLDRTQERVLAEIATAGESNRYCERCNVFYRPFAFDDIGCTETDCISHEKCIHCLRKVWVPDAYVKALPVGIKLHNGLGRSIGLRDVCEKPSLSEPLPDPQITTSVHCRWCNAKFCKNHIMRHHDSCGANKPQRCGYRPPPPPEFLRGGFDANIIGESPCVPGHCGKIIPPGEELFTCYEKGPWRKPLARFRNPHFAMSWCGTTCCKDCVTICDRPVSEQNRDYSRDQVCGQARCIQCAREDPRCFGWCCTMLEQDDVCIEWMNNPHNRA